MAGIFKAYDIRGVVPGELSGELAYRIGRAVPEVLEASSVLVSRDMRISGPEIMGALIKGINESGADVLDAAEATTPMNYFGIGHFRVGGGVQVTASHNPAQYNGFKVSRSEARPVSYDTGLGEIERLATGRPPKLAARKGSVKKADVLEPYLAHLKKFSAGIKSGIKVVVDCGNGETGRFVPRIFEMLGLEMVGMYLEPDGNFPNHEPNPLKHENLRDLQAKVIETGAALGIAYDGDGDRIAFVDEKGGIVPSDIVGAAMSRRVLADHPGAAIIYDLRSSRVVEEEIRAAGGRPLESRVGHSFIKALMREHDAPFAAELSGHYYFRENFYTDCGDLALLLLLRILAEEGKPLSEIINPLKRYAASGELNFEVVDKEKCLDALKKAFADAKVYELDGISIRRKDWWFNVRPSNTEPLLRLNLEAVDEELMRRGVQKVKEVLKAAAE
ncbi:MAG TPA: phosphomannomutase/phosphoglucomutase [Planctomycetes bacterium]|nr:phosphomannomutase/phosphoglucomutase [Planctomycetota bacterium]